MIDNWQIYKVLLNGEFRENDLVVNLTDKKPSANELVTRAVEQLWSDMVKGRKSVGKETWDSKIYSLVNYQLANSKLIIDVGLTTYKYLQGTNATYWLLGDIYGKACLANGALVQSVVFDCNGKCVFGKRNTGAKIEYEPIVIFGGTMDKEDKKGSEIKGGQNPFTAIRLELKEELGLDKNDIKDLYIKFLVEDRKYYPILYFWTFLTVTYEELRGKFDKFGDKTEHSSIVTLSNEQTRELLYETPEKASDLTLTAIDLLLNFKR